MPTSPLQRIRLLFLSAALASVVAAAVAVFASGTAWSSRAIVVVAAAGLAEHWILGYRRGEFRQTALLLEGLAILAILVACPGNAPVPLFGLLYRSLYGGPAAARFVAYIGPLLLAPLLGGTDPGYGETASRAAGLLVAGWVMPTLQRALERLERDERRLRTIVERSSDIVMIVRADLRIRWLGGTVRAVLGHDPDEVTGRSFLDLVHPEDVGEVRSRLHELVRSDTDTAMVNARIRDGEGGYHEVEAVAANRIEDPDIEGLLVSVRDMTARRRVERLRERLEAQRERQQLEAEITRARRLESVGQLAGGVAHDFNNLLAAIINCAALARDDLPPGHAAVEEITAIESAASRGARLVSQLLLFSQSRTRAERLLDLNDVVGSMDALLGSTLGDGVKLRHELDAQPTMIVADVGRLEQVLANLVVNARDAVGVAGTITIRTAAVTIDISESVELEIPSGRYVRLTVDDDGCGMDADTLARACEPFFTTKGPGGGSGLGLATVFGVARQAGGCVTVHSRPGGGTTVHVHLPAAAATAATDAAPSRVAA